MTLTIQKAEDDLRQLTLTIEVDEARVSKAMQKKARELSHEISLPGFRPGKAPYGVLVRRIGEDTLRGEAIEDLIQPVFEEALEQEDIEPYARPTLEDIETKPLVLKFTVPLTPVVTLGDYRTFRQDVEPVVVTDEALDDALEMVRIRHQTLETVERPAQTGDVVSIGGSGRFTAPKPAAESEDAAEPDEAAEDAETPAADEETAGEYIFDEERLEILLEEKTLFPDTPFVENIVGLSVGDHKAFSFTFPDPYEHEAEYAGREAAFDITVLEIKKRDLPELNDDLAKQDGDFETLDELRQSLRDNLLREAKAADREKVIDDMIHRLMEDATLVYPPAAIDLQIDSMVEDFKNRLARSGWQFQDYLNLQGMTEEDLRKDFRENAEDQLRHQIVLRQFILDEKLSIEMADIDALIEERISNFDNESIRNSMRDYFRGSGFELLSGEVLSNKAYERILAIFSGNAPDLDAIDGDAGGDAADEEE